MLSALHKRGMEKLPFQTAAEFAASLADGPARPLVAEFTVGYESVRFGCNTEEVALLVDLLRRIEALPR
jgi:hypothetical protein